MLEQRRWDRARRQVLTALADLAARRETTTYAEIGRHVTAWNRKGLHCRDRKLHSLLGNISIDAYKTGLPLLSALVFNKAKKKPGEGYWGLIREYYPDLSEEQAHTSNLDAIYAGDWSEKVCSVPKVHYELSLPLRREDEKLCLQSKDCRHLCL